MSRRKEVVMSGSNWCVLIEGEDKGENRDMTIDFFETLFINLQRSFFLKPKTRKWNKREL